MKYEDAPRAVKIPAEANKGKREPTYSVLEDGRFWTTSDGRRRRGWTNRALAQEAILKGLLARADKKAARAANLLALLARSYRERQ